MSMVFAYFILRFMSYFFCFNVVSLSIGFGDRNCVIIGCPNSGQRLGKWAATTCEQFQELVIYTLLTVKQRLKTQTQLCNLVTTRKRDTPNAHHQRHGITLM